MTLLLVLASFGVASAQETTTGSVAGQVLDPQGQAVVGAAVSVVSEQGTKTFMTDAAGHYFAPYLTPGVYAVRVKMAGFAEVERKNLNVRLGQRVDVDFTLKVSDREELIEVVGDAPTIDVTTTTVGGTLDTDVLKSLPVGRAFTSTLYMVPGVSNSSGVGAANPSIAGASGLENNYIVDGVNITSGGFGGVGSYSIVFGSLGVGVTTDFIKETQVKTGGFEAEYGQATGGVVNVVTQSGTNKFHGSLFGYLRNNALRGEDKQLSNVPEGVINNRGSEYNDVGITLSGPAIKDKLFFFGAFNPQYQTRTFIAPDNQEDGEYLYPFYQKFGETDRKRHTFAYAAKLTYQATSKHRVDMSLFGDPSKGDLGPQRVSSLLGSATFPSGDDGLPSRYSTLDKYGGHNQSLRYNGVLSQNWLVEASVARATNSINETPYQDEWYRIDLTTSPYTYSGGLGYYDKGSDDTNLQFGLKSTHLFSAAGRHQVRYGAQYEDIGFYRDINRSGPTFLLPNGVETRTGASVYRYADSSLASGGYYRVVRANWGPNPDTSTQYLSFFLQDTWQVNKKLTVRPGVRFDRQKMLGGGQKLCHADDSQPGAADGTGEEIFCTFTLSGNWAPRLGVTYDFTGTGKSKVFASFARYFLKIPNDLNARALSADAGVQRADYYDANLTQPIPENTEVGGVVEHFLTSGSYPSIFDPDTKASYQNEIMAGLEYEVAPSFNVGVRYIRRTMPRIMEDWQPAPIAAFDKGCPGADSVEYLIANINDTTQQLQPFSCDLVAAASFEDPVHNYNAFELTASKAAGNWNILASYRYAQLKGNFEGSFRADNGQSDPAITSLFDFPTNDPSYTQVGVPEFGYRGDIRYQGTTLGQGVLPNDRPHQLKVYGSYHWRDLNAGLAFNAGSGKSLTPLAANPNYTNSGEIPESLRGDGIPVTDELGNVLNGGALKSRTDAEIFVDLHLDYAIKIGEGRRVVLMADVFNVLNNQNPMDYDNYTERSFAEDNPNYGWPVNGGGSPYTSYPAPRNVRLGARVEW
jgi:hypothetical protein